MNLSYIRLLFASSLLLLFWSSSVLAAANVSVTSSGDKSYSVQGSGMDGVAGIQLDIRYDSNSLSTPTVTQGPLVSGAMLAANTTIPGMIKIAIISTRAFSSSGQIATINFANQLGSGGITSATVSMINATGSRVSATPVAISNGSGSIVAEQSSNPNPVSQQNQTDQTLAGNSSISTTNTSKSTTSTPTYLGAVTLPADLQQQAESKPAPSPTVPAFTNEPTPGRSAQETQSSGKQTAEVKPEETPQYVAYKGISERFKQYKGSKKLSDAVALFNKKVAQNISQEPALLLSNGQIKATLTVDIPARISTSPNFAVNGGKLVSFKQEKKVKGRWIVEILPEAGAVKTTMTIIAGADEFEYPLSVAPPVKTSLTFNEQGWDRFLKEVGTAKAPLHDFNNDGIRDYMDEYIFVANYLSNKALQAKPAAAKTPKKK